jgi:hypothetical protein
MMVCQECGNAAESADGFCASCGALLEWSGQPVQRPAGPLSRQPGDERRRPQPVQVLEEPAYTGPYCSSCGLRNATGRSFCRSCGERLRSDVAAPAARPGWWRRLLDRIRGRRPQRAGDRPRGFVSHDTVPAGPGSGPSAGQGAGQAVGRVRDAVHRAHRLRPPRRLALSRFGPLILVAGLAGVGLGPARGWITAHMFGVEQKVINHFHQRYVDIVPVSASASSAAPGHDPKLAIDGITQTYWLTAGRHAHGKLTIVFAKPENIDRVGLLAGEPGGSYRAQARPQIVKISAAGAAPVSLSFDDTPNFQNRPVSLHGVTSVTVTIKRAYAGQRGQAVAIREIEFFNKVS